MSFRFAGSPLRFAGSPVCRGNAPLGLPVRRLAAWRTAGGYGGIFRSAANRRTDARRHDTYARRRKERTNEHQRPLADRRRLELA
jgi:hypothetical protein